MTWSEIFGSGLCTLLILLGLLGPTIGRYWDSIEDGPTCQEDLDEAEAEDKRDRLLKLWKKTLKETR